jgi:hypothetical protein
MRLRAALGLLLAWGACADALAQGGIYTCVDGKGRKLTSDRPIPECLDREQKELTPTGAVKRVLKPALSPDDQAIEDEKNRKAIEDRARIAEEKKRERVLLARYPERTLHDRERAQALVSLQDVIATAEKRTMELKEERRKLLAEVEFFRNDRSKMPGSLKRRLDENEQNMAAQQRFVANQDQEKARVNARFDEELAKLETLWAEQRRTAASAAGAASAAAQARAARQP